MTNSYSNEELDIVNGIESGEYTSVENLNKDKNRYSEYVRNTIKKTKE